MREGGKKERTQPAPRINEGGGGKLFRGGSWVHHTGKKLAKEGEKGESGTRGMKSVEKSKGGEKKRKWGDRIKEPKVPG